MDNDTEFTPETIYMHECGFKFAGVAAEDTCPRCGGSLAAAEAVGETPAPSPALKEDVPMDPEAAATIDPPENTRRGATAPVNLPPVEFPPVGADGKQEEVLPVSEEAGVNVGANSSEELAKEEGVASPAEEPEATEGPITTYDDADQTPTETEPEGGFPEPEPYESQAQPEGSDVNFGEVNDGSSPAGEEGADDAGSPERESASGESKSRKRK